VKRLDIVKILIPNRVFFQNELHKITYLDNKYIIKKYSVVLKNNFQLEKIQLENIHPNYENNQGFCISSNLKIQTWNINIQKIIENMLITFNLDNCYFTPNFIDLKFERE